MTTTDGNSLDDRARRSLRPVMRPLLRPLAFIALAHARPCAPVREGAAIEEAELIRPVRLITAGETEDLTARRFVGARRMRSRRSGISPSRSAGRIADIPVREGARVAEGETIRDAGAG